MLETVTVIGGKAIAFTAMGVCLGVGFWLSRQATNKLEVYLASRDQKLVDECKKDLGIPNVAVEPTPAPVV